jgi:hypothetical protein
MTRHMHRLPALLMVAAAAAITLLVTASTLWAIPLADAKIRIEINATDGDAGIQMFLDGEGWSQCQVSDPNGVPVVTIQASGSVGGQGITELFFESAEPSFEDQPLETLLALFPTGKYQFDCITTEGQTLKRSATLTHRLPAGPVVHPVQLSPSVVIDWEPVEEPFQEGGDPVVIAGYEVIVERLTDGRKFSITLSAAVTSVTVPAEFIQPSTQYKGEVLAIEASGGGNQTITEFLFTTP